MINTDYTTVDKIVTGKSAVQDINTYKECKKYFDYS